jgi:competence protein ComEA
MTTGIRYFLGATLPRTQQITLLVLGLCLTGLCAWRAGLIWLDPPSSPLTPQNYFIEIKGNQPRPGVHVFAFPPTLQDVWEAAGGRGAIPNPQQSLSSGTKIIVAPEQTVTLTRMSGHDLLTLGLSLDLNLASTEDLETIPGIGPVLAKRIVEFREEYGPLKDIEALLNVKGVGRKKLERIRPYVGVTRIEADRENEEE